jgi:hypothetical protein
MSQLFTLLKLLKSLLSAVLWLGGKAGAKIIQPVLEQSHNHYLDVRAWQRRWTELTFGIDYLLTCASITDDEGSEGTILWLRNSGDACVSVVDVFVEASSGKRKYPEHVTARDLAPGQASRFKLSNIPKRELWLDTDGGIQASYQSIAVSPIAITRNGSVEEFERRNVGMHPTHIDQLNGSWTNWGGRRYNTSAIRDAMRTRRMSLTWALCGQDGLLSLKPSELWKQAVRRGRWSRLPRIMLLGCISQRIPVALMVWVPLLLRRHRISFEPDELETRATQHVLSRGEGPRPTRIRPLSQ